MNRKQAFVKFARFYSFGQYRAEHIIKNYVITQIVDAVLWAGIACAVMFYLNKGVVPAVCVFIIPICVKSLLSLTEPASEKGYDLADFLPAGISDIFKLRMLIRLFTPDEYFFHIALFFLCIRSYGTGAGIVIAFAAAVCCIALSEIMALAGRKTNRSRLWAKFAFVSLILLMLSCLPGLFGYYMGAGENAVGIIQAAAFAGFLAFAVLAAVNYFGHPYGAAGKGCEQENVNIKSSVPKQIGTLMKKDLRYLLRQKPDILYSSVIYLAILFLMGDTETFAIFLPMYFALEFGLEFGFNCFGHDNESFVPMLLSPISRRTIVREKSIFILLINLVYIVIAYAAGTGLGTVALKDSAYFLGQAFFALGVVLFLSVPFSIKFYYRVNGKKNYTPKFIFISLGLFLIFILIEVILDVVIEELGLSKLPIFILGLVVLLAAVYFMCVNGKSAAKRLEKRERVLLDKFLDNSEEKKTKPAFSGNGGFGNRGGFGTSFKGKKY